MHALTLLLSPLAFASATGTNWNIRCDYVFYQVPFSTVELAALPDGHFVPGARISMQGASHFESYTEEMPSANERVHGWISKESPDNRIELVIYKDPQPEGQTKIVNHQMPIGQDVWGTCTYSVRY
jgi:hypothetical protein